MNSITRSLIYFLRPFAYFPLGRRSERLGRRLVKSKILNGSEFSQIYNEFPTAEICDFDRQFSFDLYLLNIYLNLENGDVRNLD